LASWLESTACQHRPSVALGSRAPAQHPCVGASWHTPGPSAGPPRQARSVCGSRTDYGRTPRADERRLGHGTHQSTATPAHLRCLCCRGPRTRGLAIESRSQPSTRPQVPQLDLRPAAVRPRSATPTLARAVRTKSDTRSLERGVRLVTSLVRQATVKRGYDPSQSADRARARPGGSQQPHLGRHDTLGTGSHRPDGHR